MALTTILIGCDLSASSEQAVEAAVNLAKHQAAPAKLVLVHAQGSDAPIPDANNELVAQLGEVTAAIRTADALRISALVTSIEARGVVVDVVSRIGPPAEILAAVAVERHAELIVVGTHGNTGITRFLLGSVASETIRQAPCDVLVCRGPVRAPFSRPIVAMDFSSAAIRALEHTVPVIVADVTIEVVHAWQLPAGSWGASLLGQARFPWSTVRDAVLSSAKTQCDKLAKELPSLGHPLHFELVQGPPATVLTTTAEKGGHDLIAVGTHGTRGFRRLLLGSVAESTIRHSPCSVLVVHSEHAGDTARFHRVDP
jgi:nucleotide-binding universal stress UspA family protein